MMGCGSNTNEVVNIAKGIGGHTKEAGGFTVARGKICDKCDQNVKGVCQIVEAKHPGKAAIFHGIKRPTISCPIGKWPAEKVDCPTCIRVIKVSPVTGVCKWCENKLKLQQKRNLKSAGMPITFSPRDHEVNPSPFTREPTKHLHFFLYPRYEISVRYHLEKLRETIGQFDGRRVCCVATNRNTIHEQIMPELHELFTDVYTVDNNINKRELVGFIPSLEIIQNHGGTSDDDVICFAHAKGQQEHTAEGPTVRLWTDVMYETVVNNWPAVSDAMEAGYPLAGSFKCIGAFRSSPFRWHYSGSFYWIRASAIFMNNRWKETCKKWWGTESYPGRHWMPHEGHCLFADNVPCGTVYQQSLWDERLTKELDEWRKTK